TTMPPPTHDGGSGGMSSTSTDACSCTTNRNYDDLGTVHVCTGSIDMKACDTLSCSHGNHRAYACSSDDVRLCCELPHQLYSQLYDDCDHPRCELGFRAECESEGGRIHSGACDIPDNVKKGSGGGGICSVARASSSEPGRCAFLLLAVAAVSRLRRRAR
ncbi:MAG TPA: hypothetical protein VHM19_11775, partial [Polyangiales bacterium]|nr:hypothetical protein [Polyangiales bacterium]